MAAKKPVAGKPQKPMSRRIPSDDCLFTLDGESYAIHAGEWVDVFPVLTIADTQALTSLQAIGDQLAIAEGDSSALLSVMGTHFDTICAMLARRILAWNWTDMSGVPMPQPKGAPQVIADLSLDEMTYLIALVRGDAPADRKNA